MKRKHTKKKQRPKLKLKKNDVVRVITGEDQGVEGRILSILPDEMRVVVEGVNIRKRHMRPTQDNPEGQIVEREMPIHYSNVMLVDDEGGVTRLGINKVEENDNIRSARIARTTGKEL